MSPRYCKTCLEQYGKTVVFLSFRELMKHWHTEDIPNVLWFVAGVSGLTTAGILFILGK